MTSITPYNSSNIILFTPDQISGLALWLDSADSTTIQLSGANVTQWNDKSGNGRNFTTTSGTPTYSPPNGINFVGSRFDIMSTTLTVPYTAGVTTIFVVVRVTGTGSNGLAYVLVFGNNTSDSSLRYNNFSGVFNANDAFNTQTWYLNGTQGGALIPTSIFNNTTLLNGRINFTGNTVLQLSTSFLGRYLTGFIQEVIIYSSITTEQRQQVESYLAYKWNLQRNLPTTHPYYATPYNAYYGLPIPYNNFTNNLSRFPSEIPGLNLWLDAADSRTVTLSGNSVTEWRDKSGSNNSATQVTSLNQPTYSNTFVNFNGTNNFLNVNLNFLAGATHNSFIVIRNFNFTNIYGALTSALSNQSLHVGFAGGTTYRINFWGNDYYPPITSNYRANQINLLNFQWVNNTSKSAFANASLEGTSNQPGIIGTMAGGGSIGGVTTQGGQPQNFLSANIYEIMIYTGILTVAQRQQIEGYLAYKWNLQSFLPPNHAAYIQPLPVAIPRNIQNYNISPTQYAACVLWLDALDSSRIGLSGVNITSLRDKSSNAYLFSNATGFTYNVNKFNGTYPSFFSSSATTGRNLGSNISVNFTQPLTVFVVCSKLTTANGAYLFDGVVDANRIAYYSVRGRVFAGSEIAASTDIISNPCVISAIYNTTNSVALLNGTQYTSGNVGTRTLATGLTLGSRFTVNESWDGHICEIIFYNSVLLEQQRQQIEGYLAWKWGIQRSLATNHRFYNFPPG